MNRNLLLQVTAPTVLIGLLLFTACLVGAWFTNRSHRELTKLLSREVASLQAAQELEIRVRQLRWRNFLDHMDPKHARPELIREVQLSFEHALERARQASRTREEQALVEKISHNYQRYQHELVSLPHELKAAGEKPDLHVLADAHPIKYVVDPCQELLRINRDQMDDTVQQSDRVSTSVRWTMLALGIIGPLSGLLAGYGVARGLSRSIYQLSVRVHDMSRKLDRTVGSVTLPADGNVQHLDKQLQHVLQRVEQVAEDYRRHQREMLRAEQLSAVGQLAASVAHEVRNPLTGIKLLVEAALRPHHRQPLSEEDLTVIHGEVVRLEQTVQSFLDFARPPAPQRAICDLRELAAQAGDLVRARARQQQVALKIHTPDREILADLDRNQLRTVLVNLFLNALDAMPRGGCLEVHLTAALSSIQLKVVDTGTGIAPAMAARLFTPFASTKPTGTGLGLSISQRIIEEHGGNITGANRPEGGACFTIVLPVPRSVLPEK